MFKILNLLMSKVQLVFVDSKRNTKNVQILMKFYPRKLQKLEFPLRSCDIVFLFQENLAKLCSSIKCEIFFKKTIEN